MKIAISADGSDLQSKVGHKLGTSRYLIIFDTESGDFETVPNPSDSRQTGAGIQAVLLAVSKGVKTLVVGYCSPAIKSQLKANNIEIISGVSGTVAEVTEKYKKGELKLGTNSGTVTELERISMDKDKLVQATRGSAKQFFNLLPILVGVVLLIGLFNAFVSKDFLSSIFTGNIMLDTIWGACFGSIIAGNPINSYVIAGELLKYDISLFGVTALILTWVTVGLVQLPAEMAALGKRFAILRNVLSFVIAIPISIITVAIVNLIVR